MGQPPGGPAGLRRRQAEAGQDIGLALRLVTDLGQPKRTPQFCYPILGVAEIAQCDTGGLMGD
jgi:hypothetical protein